MKVIRRSFAELGASIVQRMTRRSLFGSPGFIQLWKTVGGTDYYWTVEADNDIVAILPVVEFGAGPFRRAQSLPDGCYSTFFSEETNPNIEALKAELLAAIERVGYARFYLNDYFRLFQPIQKEWEVCQSSTLVADISSPTWAPPDTTLRSEIRKAERENVSVGIFEAERHLQPFLTLMNQTEQRHGRRPKYPEQFYRALANIATIDSRILWLYCEHEGEAIASQIFLIENEMALNWQNYLNKKHSSFKAGQYLTATAAVMLKKRGVTHLNFGSSPLAQSNDLQTYKKKWGGVEKTYPCYIRKSFLGRLW
ncbi:MAG: GNAT family N-acetyltransferase [candidate division Zixibacteria bacterium]|nr:GNAT family N-acetyltransferase [candidate division Zixibacteria bacterium]